MSPEPLLEEVGRYREQIAQLREWMRHLPWHWRLRVKTLLDAAEGHLEEMEFAVENPIKPYVSAIDLYFYIPHEQAVRTILGIVEGVKCLKCGHVDLLT